MLKEAVRPASSGDPSLLVVSIPANVAADGEDTESYAIALEFRRGGLLLAMPPDVLSAQILQDGQLGAEDSLFGPNSKFSSPLVEEAEDFSLVPTGIEAESVVVDVNDDVLGFCREYDPVTDSLTTNPSSLPDVIVLLSKAKTWLEERHDERSGFYTAQEDPVNPPKAAQNVATKKANAAKRITNIMLSEQLGALTAQLTLLSQRQDALEKMGSPSAAPVGGVPCGQSSKQLPLD